MPSLKARIFLKTAVVSKAGAGPNQAQSLLIDDKRVYSPKHDGVRQGTGGVLRRSWSSARVSDRWEDFLWRSVLKFDELTMTMPRLIGGEREDF